MPPVTGKSGTLSPAHFTELTSLVNRYGAKVIARKVAKVCSKWATHLNHEYGRSSVAAAFNGVSTKIMGSMGAGDMPISQEGYTFLGTIVRQYGAEVVVNKIGKIAGKGGDNTLGVTLRGLFPR